MSRTNLVRLLVVPAAVALIAACDSSATAPASAMTRVKASTASIEGDTLQCRNGWVIISGRYECNAT
jgi:hypothetical protein